MRTSLFFAAALVCAAPTFAQTKVFTFDEALGRSGVSLSPMPQASVSWGSGTVYKLTKEGVERFIDARTGKDVPQPKDGETGQAPSAATGGRRARRGGGSSLTSPDGMGILPNPVHCCGSEQSFDSIGGASRNACSPGLTPEDLGAPRRAKVHNHQSRAQQKKRSPAVAGLLLILRIDFN